MNFKPAIIAALPFFFVTSALPAAAAQEGAKPAAIAAASHKGEGTVNKVDAKAGTFNMTHGPIPSLNWPPMTMDFQVKDKSALKGVQPGQKVKISIVQEGEGKFVVTEIKPVK